MSTGHGTKADGRRRRTPFFVLGVVLGLLAAAPAGCGDDEETTASEDVRQRTASAELVRKEGSDAPGAATLRSLPGGRTEVVVKLPGAAGRQAVRVYRAECSNIGKKAVHLLEDARDGTSRTLLGVSLDELDDGDHVIVVHEPAPDEDPAACGEISRELR